jgi:DNA-binding transcriptional LysR family regulator
LALLNIAVSPGRQCQTIRSLEEHFRVRLLNRTTRSVALTEAGEELLGKLNPVIEGLPSAQSTPLIDPN